MGEGEERGTEREFVIFTYQEKKVKRKTVGESFKFLICKNEKGSYNREGKREMESLMRLETL